MPIKLKNWVTKATLLDPASGPKLSKMHLLTLLLHGYCLEVLPATRILKYCQKTNLICPIKIESSRWAKKSFEIDL